MKLQKVTVTLITIVLVTLFAACPTVDPLFQKTQIVAILEVTSLNREQHISAHHSKTQKYKQDNKYVYIGLQFIDMWC